MTPTRRRYPTDLTDPEWQLLAPLIPASKPGGRPPCMTAEWHWHGGTTSSAMTHVAVQVRDSTDRDVAEHDWASDYDEM